MRAVSELSVFIASPSDVAEERGIVREECERLNRDPLIRGRGLSFRAVGWEDAFPAPGRPQDIVNRLAAECDIFFCLFHRRFGSVTGKADSGTLEEFLLAYGLWERLKKPQIQFYFKEVKVSSLEELGDPELRKVFDLKKKIKENRLLLYKEYSAPEEFRGLLAEHIRAWAADRFAPAPDAGRRAAGKAALEIPEAYRRWIGERLYMDIDRMREKSEVIQVSLPEIYVPLYADDPGAARVKTAEDEAVSGLREGRTPVDIEELAVTCETLVVSGTAGSGKTTLMKHLAHRLLEPGGLPGLEGRLPVLIFLKDLKVFAPDPAACAPGAECVFEQALSRYIAKTENGLDLELVRGFCEAGRAVILVDGLDETDPDPRAIFIEALAAFRNRLGARGPRVVLAGRPHGVDEAVERHFGRRRVAILPFTMGQVEDFVTRWFRHVYDARSRIGRKTAADMIGEIKAHPGTGALIDNPLMLTAVCILYHDGRELPGQRAELYKKFVANLLPRRFKDENEKVLAFLQKIAGRTFREGLRGLDRAAALAALAGEYPRQPAETEADHRARLEGKFDDIEPGCGLLAFESGQYVFRHQTFQEYLTATDLVSRETDYSAAIRGLWEDERFREVVELYVGFLSIENKAWANKIVAEVLGAADRPPYHRFRLAGRALLAMHPDRREIGVLDLATEKLRQIIESDAPVPARADAGETLGWLEDRRDLEKFILIPEGSYKTSRGKIAVRGLEIGAFPVTNRRFRKFVEAGGYGARGLWSPEGLKWLDFTRSGHPQYWHERRWICPNAPVVGVSWYEADAFARWLTSHNDGFAYRLPDENEWEAAAAGQEGREYPWGKWEEGRCNTEETKIGKTTPVGIFKRGNTPEGVGDLAGNVWEWTRTDFHKGRTQSDFKFDKQAADLWAKREITKYISLLDKKDRNIAVLRGGSWYYFRDIARCADRDRYDPGVRLDNLGFRCVRTKK